MEGEEAAGCGHPGAPMAQAPLAYLLWTRYLRFQPTLREANAEMDDVSPANVAALEADARRHLDEHAEDFAVLCDFLAGSVDRVPVMRPS